MKKKKLPLILFFSVAGMSVALTEVHAGDWASIAFDPAGYWGYAYGKNSSEEAQRDAWLGCGSSRFNLLGAPPINCQIGFAAKTKCIAFAESRAGGYWVGFAFGNDRESVKNTALSGCAQGAPGGSCAVIFDWGSC